MPTVLIIQENGRHEENRNFRECFSLQRGLEHHGAEVDVWGLGHANHKHVPRWDDYDLIVNLENYDQTGWVPNLANVKAKKYLWSIDAHVKGVQPYINTSREGKYDLILQATPEFITGNSIWFPNCYDDDLVLPKEPKEEVYDVGFCGNTNNRSILIAYLEGAFGDRFKFDEFVIGDSMVNAVNSYKVHWNCNIGCDINYRNFETMGCKTTLLTSDNKHYGKLGIAHGKTCMTYKNPKTMLDAAKTLLDFDDFRIEIAEAGYNLVKNNHTYKHRAQTILELLDENR